MDVTICRLLGNMVSFFDQLYNKFSPSLHGDGRSFPKKNVSESSTKVKVDRV